MPSPKNLLVIALVVLAVMYVVNRVDTLKNFVVG